MSPDTTPESVRLDAYTQKNADEFRTYYQKLNEQYKSGPQRTASKPGGLGAGGKWIRF